MQGHQPIVHPVRMENPHELQGSKNIMRPGSAGADVGARVSERPKLNLKPRSLPVEQSDENTERGRSEILLLYFLYICKHNPLLVLF